MEQEKPMELEIPKTKTKERFGAMVHKVNTDKLRVMLREVIILQ